MPPTPGGNGRCPPGCRRRRPFQPRAPRARSRAGPQARRWPPGPGPGRGPRGAALATEFTAGIGLTRTSRSLPPSPAKANFAGEPQPASRNSMACRLDSAGGQNIQQAQLARLIEAVDQIDAQPPGLEPRLDAGRRAGGGADGEVVAELEGACFPPPGAEGRAGPQGGVAMSAGPDVPQSSQARGPRPPAPASPASPLRRMRVPTSVMMKSGRAGHRRPWPPGPVPDGGR